MKSTEKRWMNWIKNYGYPLGINRRATQQWTKTKVVPRNEAGPLRTWPLLIVILRISNSHFLQRVRVFFKHFRWSSKRTPLSKGAHFWGSAASWCAKKWPFSAEGPGLGKKSARSKAVSKINHPRQAPKCCQTTEPDPPETIVSAKFCKLLNEETGEAEVPLPVKGLRKINSPICGRIFTFFTEVAENHSKALKILNTSLINP